jgi:saccharopine dehydrogenase-like NADP-dependent oxidoreductase
MANIIILGGTGNTGKMIARHLLTCGNVNITISARNLERAKDVDAELNSAHSRQPTRAVCADARDAESLRVAFRGHDLVVVAAPTTMYAENVIRTALRGGSITWMCS